MLLAATLSLVMPLQEGGEILSWLKGNESSLVEQYKDLHASPELSFQEKETSAKMAQVLSGLGFQVQTQIGGYGVAGVLRNGDGPTVLVRADMDALPILEETGLAYASQVKGLEQSGREVPVMHACGHDIHMTVWSGMAGFLATHKELWSGTLLFVAQPAEERGAGARAMLEDGLYERTVTPEYCLAFHVAPNLPAGMIGACPGYALANVDSVDILVRGKGGHGSTPELTHDPVVLASKIILALQTLVSREVATQKAAVVTVGSVHGGEKHNIIPNEVKLQLTIRSYEPEVRNALLDGIRRTAKHEALSAGFPLELLPIVELLPEHTPAAWNSPGFMKRVANSMKTAIGEKSVLEVPPVMGGEDFGLFAPAADSEGAIFWLGVVSQEDWAEAQKPDADSLPGLHTSRFSPDPALSIRTGVLAMTEAVMDLLPPTQD